MSLNQGNGTLSAGRLLGGKQYLSALSEKVSALARVKTLLFLVYTMPRGTLSIIFHEVENRRTVSLNYFAVNVPHSNVAVFAFFSSPLPNIMLNLPILFLTL
jgi:hypothetical protein